MKPLAKTDFFRRSDPFAASFFTAHEQCISSCGDFLVASSRQRRLFRLRIRFFSCAGDTYFSGDRLDKEAPASAAAGYGGVL